MSDDTPTERFVPPTAPLSTPAGAEPGRASGPSDGHPRSRTLTVILSVIGGLLLIAVIILLILLFSSKNGTPQNSASPSPQPSTSESPSAEASASASAAPSTSPQPSTAPSPSSPPTTTGPVFTSFEPANNASVGCANDTDPVSVTFTWASTGAVEAAIGVATTDAFAGFYQTGLPASGSFDLDYQCNLASQFYTVSIKGPSGQTNQTVTLKR